MSSSDRFAEGGRLGGLLRGLLAGIPWSESAKGHERVLLPAPSGGRLEIHNANGRTRIQGEDRDDIEVLIEKHARAESLEAAEAMIDAMELIHEEVAGTLELEVEIPTRWNRHGSAHLVVLAPRGLSVSVVSANGRVCMAGMRAHVKARNSNGAVHISDVIGDIEVFTSNAKVSCDATCGRLKARSSNSKIELDQHEGSVDAATSNGVICANICKLGHEGIVLSTSNGRILLELPEQVDAEVDVRVDNGVIRNSRPIEAQPDESRGRLRGRLGLGGTLIKLRTSNGTVSLS